MTPAQKLVRRLLGAPAPVPGYLPLVRQLQASKVAIVMYHGVTARPPAVFNWCQLEADRFQYQIDFLTDHYVVLHLDDVVRRLRGGQPLPPRAACITFDDGFRNVATTAFPILEKRQLPSTVFLVTGLVGTRQPAWPDRLYWSIAHSLTPVVRVRGQEYLLGAESQRADSYRRIAMQLKPLELVEREEELARLADALGGGTVPADAVVATLDWVEVQTLARTDLVRFGSHTHTHPILSRCPLEVQHRELSTSRAALLEHGLSADLFAYPNGTAADFTPDTERLLREVGYVCGVTTIPGLNPRGSDLYALRRVSVGADSPDLRFRRRMAGL